MLRTISTVAILAFAAAGSAQFYKGTQGVGTVLSTDGAQGKISYGVLQQFKNASTVTDVSRLFAGSFQFDATTGTPWRIVMSKPTKILVSLNVADFSGPAQMWNPLSASAYLIQGTVSVHVRDVTKPGSAVTIMDEISFTFVPTTANSQPYSFNGWAKNGVIEVFGGYSANLLQ